MPSDRPDQIKQRFEEMSGRILIGTEPVEETEIKTLMREAEKYRRLNSDMARVFKNCSHYLTLGRENAYNFIPE